ncbi:MAG TPA: ankyrin repeat domain-containing protein, partial [Candidatus Angelobacter sp.]|nr:ankyrin repeat domain-containing protein [Candidatus Angelobacter sp.]
AEAHVEFQVRLIEATAASLKDRSAFHHALLDLDPAVLHCPVPPPSRVYVHAFSYAQTQLLPMLRRIWPLPDDLPHAAGNGDFERVRSWFDAAGVPALGDLANHFPANDEWIRANLQWGRPSPQQVLDTALAWAVMNNHFEIAGFLLEHGADINTDWSSHEPASILHELVWHKNYQAMQFLIDHGIDMTTRDYRWDATAVGWAAVPAKDEKMAQWMRDAQQRREQASG